MRGIALILSCSFATALFAGETAPASTATPVPAATPAPAVAPAVEAAPAPAPAAAPAPVVPAGFADGAIRLGELPADAALAALPQVDTAKIPLIASLIPASASYAVQPKALRDGNSHLFRIETPRGAYVVRGLRNLVQTCLEAEAIEAYYNGPYRNNFLIGVWRYVGAVGLGTANLFVHPVASVRSVGRMPVREARDVGRFLGGPYFRRKEVDADGVYRSTPAKGFLYSKDIRTAAFELGTDVYSNNPVHNATLREIGRPRGVAKWGMMGAAGATGVSPFDMLQSTLTPGELSGITEELIRDNSPHELKRINGKLYRDLGGYWIEGGPTWRLINCHSYSPREQFLLAAAISQIRPENLEETLDFLARTERVEQAAYRAAQMELLLALHRQAKIVRFLPAGAEIGALDEQGVVHLALPWDVADEKAMEPAVAAALASAGAKAKSVRITIAGEAPAKVQAAIAVEAKPIAVGESTVTDTQYGALIRRLGAPVAAAAAEAPKP